MIYAPKAIFTVSIVEMLYNRALLHVTFQFHVRWLHHTGNPKSARKSGLLFSPTPPPSPHPILLSDIYQHSTLDSPFCSLPGECLFFCISSSLTGGSEEGESVFAGFLMYPQCQIVPDTEQMLSKVSLNESVSAGYETWAWWDGVSWDASEGLGRGMHFEFLELLILMSSESLGGNVFVAWF